MSKRAEEAALKEYPSSYSEVNRNAKRIQSYKVDTHKPIRQIYIKGYEQAEKDTIERACQLLYDYNSQMVKMFGPKAFLSCNQFTIDVDRFRKTLIMEEEK